MEKKIARGFSCLFHPLLIPLYILLLLLNKSSFFSGVIPLIHRLILVLVVFLTTCFFPLIITFFMRRLALVSSYHLIYKEERIYLLLVMAVFYCVTYYLLKGIHLLLIFNYFMLGAAMLAILSAIISYYRKISLHMLAAGSTVGLFTGLSLNYGIMFTSEILICVFLSGLIGFARLRTESHTPGEVYAGFILGSALMTSLVFLF